MIKEGIPASRLNVKAFESKNIYNLASDLSIKFADTQGEGETIIHDITFLNTKNGIGAFVVYSGVPMS